MSIFSGITKEQVLSAIGSIMADISLFAPEPIASIAKAIAAADTAIEAVLRAKDSGTTNEAIVAAVSGVTIDAADAEMMAKFPNG